MPRPKYHSPGSAHFSSFSFIKPVPALQLRPHFTTPIMTPRSLANTVYLECLAFTITALLATSDVAAEGGSDTPTRKSSGVVGGVAYNKNSVCYDGG
jgi:hypothetical protein